jgi:hypothetical protein
VFSERDAVFVNYPASDASQRTNLARFDSRTPLATLAYRDQALRLLAAPSGASSESTSEDGLCGGGRVPQEEPEDEELEELEFRGLVKITTSLSAS